MAGSNEGLDSTTLNDTAQWLVVRVEQIDAMQANWLIVLGDFDATAGWGADGYLTGVDWLTHRGRMSRSAASEKLQVARALRLRPVLAEAFLARRLSYSAVRALARMTDPDADVDRAMVDVAEAATVADVERVVRSYRLYRDQDLEPAQILSRRGLAVRDNRDGTHTISVTVTELEAAELMAMIGARAWADRRPDSAAVDSPDSPDSAAGGGADSAAADSQTWSSRQADALMDLVREGVALQQAGAGGEDRYLVDVVRTADGVTLLDGTPLDSATAGRLSCDASSVEVLLGPDWEPVAVGRKSKRWTLSQRRAARVRDGGKCRFPGCHRRRVDLHHHQHWAAGGPTDISNGFLLCDRHHTMLHNGFTATGEPNRELTFHRPDGIPVGTTRPADRERALHPVGHRSVTIT